MKVTISLKEALEMKGVYSDKKVSTDREKILMSCHECGKEFILDRHQRSKYRRNEQKLFFCGGDCKRSHQKRHFQEMWQG